MKPEQISFLETVAQGSDKAKWQDIFETLIAEVKDDVMAKKIGVDAGNEAVELLRQVLNKITLLDVKVPSTSKNPAI